MKKMIKLLSIGTLTSITSLQVVACTDDSKYTTFINDVNNSKSQSTAIFGFLGSADDKLSQGLFDAFDYWQNKAHNTFQAWKDEDSNKKAMSNIGINDIQLKEYEGSYHQTPQSISDFWNDKSISWQRNIFKWVVNNLTSTSFKTAQGVSAVVPVNTTQLDSNKNVMFAALPIVFCIVKGELYTAGQSWIDAGSTPESQVEAMTNFITQNILTPR